MGTLIPSKCPLFPIFFRNGGIGFWTGYTVSILTVRLHDVDLDCLDRLTQLRELGLGKTKVTDSGLRNLRNLTKLKELYLVETKITDAGMMNLQQLRKLQSLNLGDTKVTDGGLINLKGINGIADARTP